MLIVAVGSRNPSKIRGVKKAFEKTYKTYVKILNYAVKTSLPPQPIGLSLTIRGAVERALAIKSKVSADFYVGLEAGLVPIPATITGYMDFQIAAIMDNENKVTLGFGPGFEFPSNAIEYVLRGGREIEEAMVKISEIENIGDKMGAIGFLTNNVITRENLSELAVIMALVPRIKRNLYREIPSVHEVLDILR